MGSSLNGDYCHACDVSEGYLHHPSCNAVPRPETKDVVNSPSHYTAGKVEVIDYILQVTKDYPGSEAALVGNVIKYISRAPHKGKKREDLEKARWYLNKLLEII